MTRASGVENAGRAVVGLRRLRGRRAVAAGPVVAVVAVDVRADRARAAVRLAVLAPAPVGRARDVVLAAIGVDHRDDPDLALVDQPGDRRVRAIAGGEPRQHGQRLLRRQVLAGVVEPVEHDLGLVLVEGHVVRHLDRPDVAALVALADRLDLDDVGVRGLRGLDRRHHLGVVVIPAVLGREGGRGGGGIGCAGGQEDGREQQRDGEREGGGSGMHAPKDAPRGPFGPPRDGASEHPDRRTHPGTTPAVAESEAHRTGPF